MPMPILTPRTGIVIVAFLALCHVLIQPASADLTAVWLAGEFLRDGRPDLVYPHDTGIFTMLPPPEWFARQASHGIPGDVFPYLYPPLWAALAAGLASVADLPAILAVTDWLNPILLTGCLVLACRAARTSLPMDIWTLTGLFLLMLTSIGLIAIGQSQPQILVAFLTLLAIERSEAGAPKTAGAALAMAAAIKLFPALLALIWLCTGNRRAALAFATAGVTLGLASVLIAGWPLHAEFIRMMGLVSRTGLATNLSYSLDSMTGQLFLQDSLVFIQSPVRDPALGIKAGWSVLPKPPVLRFVMLAAQAGILILAIRALRRETLPSRRAAIWAASLTFLTFFGPVGWSYYYIAPAAFLPLLLVRFGMLRGLLILVMLLAPISIATPFIDFALDGVSRPLIVISAIVILCMGAIFIRLARNADA
jgi:alpha-1,2-mannosyltransferase